MEWEFANKHLKDLYTKGVGKKFKLKSILRMGKRRLEW